MSNFLESMKFPEDIKYLNEKELQSLGEEIREFLVNSVSKTGGHLASNLGVVELTLCLFKTFNIEKDKIIWDVGHQSYVHKILTGRKDQFDKLRKSNGISGFPKRNESKYDAFDTGHSSTSISAALGMARARDIKGEDYKVVAVIGDGALTGGMAYEALNDAGFKKSNIIVILNDNQMSISKNVGGLSKYLNRVRIDPSYAKIKDEINATLDATDLGKSMKNSLGKIKSSLKQLVVPANLFENMGVRYIGPIDGHNIAEMNSVFEKVKALKGPVIIHTITKKGKGYELAEKNPLKFHGIAPFNLENGETRKRSQRTYSEVFGETLIDIAEKDKDVVAITAAMPAGTGLNEYSEKYPDRFFDVGIAEQHAVTLAAGMAVGGLKPVFVVYSTFLQRAFDQIVHDVCLQKLPVVFCIDRAGIVGEDGETHQGIMDVSFLSIIPNMTIVAPKCLDELPVLMKWALSKDHGPIAIRYPRGGDEIEEIEPIKEVELGKWETINQGEDIAIIATGKMVQHAIKAASKLKKDNINPYIINAMFIKPMDLELLDKLFEKKVKILVVEDNMIKAGLGDTILSLAKSKNYTKDIEILGYDDVFIPQGKVDDIYKENHLDEDSITQTVIKMISDK